MGFSTVVNVLSGIFGFVTNSLLIYILLEPIWFIFIKLWNYSGGLAKPLISEALCRGNIKYTPDSLGLFDLIGVAMAIGVGFSIIVFLVGRITGNSRLEIYMKNEILELLITYGVIVLGLALLYLPCDIYWISFNNIKLNLYESAFVFLQYVEIYSFFMLILDMMMGVIFFTAASAKVTNAIFGGLSLPAFVGVTSIYKPMFSNSLTVITLGYLVYSFQTLLYEVLTYGSIKYILPFGIFLRALGPFKKLGGALIGFSLGVTLFYTIILALGWNAVYPYMSYFDLNILSSKTNQNAPGYFEVDYDLDFGSDRVFFENIFGLSRDTFEDLERYTEQANLNRIKKDVSNEFYTELDPNIETVGHFTYQRAPQQSSGIIPFFFKVCGGYFIILLLYPIIVVLFVVTGVRFMSKFFGLDIDISNLTRVI